MSINNMHVSPKNPRNVRDFMCRRLRSVCACCAVIAVGCTASPPAWTQARDLEQLSIEELTNLEVTSVLKRPEPLSRSPAAVYVITQEEIRRSGAISLPEALRLAPNLQVARFDSGSYAVSARGFNTFQASNKLLVLIDGRSVYTPLHAGVYWDQQQMPLQDIERIEVISGPGGTLWGANAVNGVINIVTRTAWHTEGAAVALRAGTVDSGATGRYGGRLGNTAYRIYAMGYERGEMLDGEGEEVGESWDGRQAGFRADWQRENDTLTVQGDLFDNSFELGSIDGGNIKTQWTRMFDRGSVLDVKFYYDEVDRNTGLVTDELETFDLDLQHRFELGHGHHIVWGGGHRITHDRFANRLNPFVLDPESDTVWLTNAFVQGTAVLNEATSITLGTKLEYSSFTGLEFLPSVRLGWHVSDTGLLWGAVSRAVRTPSRIDQELVFPGLLAQAPDFDSEVVIAYEVGYRGRPTTQASLSLSLFYNDYEKLRMLRVTPAGVFQYANAMQGNTYGAELWGDYQVLPWWRLSVGANLLEKDLERAPDTLRPVLYQHAGNDPEYQYSLRSSMDLPRQIELDVALRAVDDLPDPIVDAYVELDARIGWHISSGINVSIAGFNLLDRQHIETGDPGRQLHVRRSVHFEFMWRF